jgi:hypothetical protein
MLSFLLASKMLAKKQLMEFHYPAFLSFHWPEPFRTAASKVKATPERAVSPPDSLSILAGIGLGHKR